MRIARAGVSQRELAVDAVVGIPTKLNGRSEDIDDNYSKEEELVKKK